MAREPPQAPHPQTASPSQRARSNGRETAELGGRDLRFSTRERDLDLSPGLVSSRWSYWPGPQFPFLCNGSHRSKHMPILELKYLLPLKFAFQ